MRELALLLGCLLTIRSEHLEAEGSSQQPMVSEQLSEAYRSTAAQCRPCALLFTKLSTKELGATIDERGRRDVYEQIIKMIERGEPKSGTGMMLQMAGGCLVHTCDYLNGIFGENSCTVSLMYTDDKNRPA